MKKLITVCAVVMLIAGMAQAAITFAPGDYDNTANTVVDLYPPTHTQTPVNNQTTGLFRDIFWWGRGYGGSQQGVGSPDFINSGKSLILTNNHAAPNPLSPYTALNFTGCKIPNGGQSFLSIYDTTPGDGATTKDVFDAQTQTGIHVSADVLFANSQHLSSGGVVALYNEGQDALALLATQNGGNNQDVPKLSLIWQSAGAGTLLTSISLPATTFDAAEWYRVTMDLTVAGDTWTVNGTIQNHVTPTDPTSGLDPGLPIWSLLYTGSLSDPNPVPGLDRVLTNPGEVGLMAGTTTGYSDAAVNGNGANPCVDNIGVSITNFQVIPEPATIGLLGLGALSLLRRRKNS
jgi:hypothetical protein